jgi:DNA primase large subunit
MTKTIPTRLLHPQDLESTCPSVLHPAPPLFTHKPLSYDRPPLDNITLDEFETAALNRLRVLAEIESCAARNRTWEETKGVVKDQTFKHLRLTSSTHKPEDDQKLRKLDNIGHFVLRLAFSRSYVSSMQIRETTHNSLREDLRKRFVKAESTLFKARFEDETAAEKDQFLASRDFKWIMV